MKKVLLTTVLLLIAFLSWSQQQSKGNLYSKQAAPKLLLGQWKGSSVSMSCDAIAGFNEMMDNAPMRSSLQMVATKTTLDFLPNGKLIKRFMDDAVSGRYQLTNNGVNFTLKNSKNKLENRYHTILSLTDDTLVYTTVILSGDPKMKVLLGLLDAEKDKTKKIIYTDTYYRMKPAVAPWLRVPNDIPKNKKMSGLIANGSTFFALATPNEPTQYFADGTVKRASDSVYSSDDFGSHWRVAVKGLPALYSEWGSQTCMVSSANKIFIGSQSGVYVSDNKGQSWARISALPVKDSSGPAVFLTATGNRVAALVDSKLYLSGDEGSSWDSATMDGLPEFLVSQRLYANGSNIIFSAVGFLRFSSDNGKTWNNIANTLDLIKYPGILADGFTIGRSIFLQSQYGLLRSGDEGNTWQEFTNGLPADDAFSNVIAQGTYLFYGGTRGVFLSIDNGEHWLEVNNKELQKGVISLAIVESKILALTPDNKLYIASIDELGQSTLKDRK